MHILQDFIPDFSQKIATGVICNRKSTIRYFQGLCFISLFNRVNIWNLKTQELLYSLGSRKHSISTFQIQENFIFIGYEDGSIEIIKDFNLNSVNESIVHKAHVKKVTKILNFANLLISSSIDGTICCYDLLLEEIKFFYFGNSFAVESIFISDNQKLLGVCSDRSVKIWDVTSSDLKDAIIFDDDIFDIISVGLNAFVSFKNGKSMIVNLETKERKPFENFKNIRNIKLMDSFLYVQCQRKLIIFQITKKDNLSLVAIQRITSNPEYTNFDILDNQICFISTENKIILGNKTIDFGFHGSDILDIKTDHSKVFSLSKDRLVCWNKIVENPLKDEKQTGDIEIDEFTKESLEFFSNVDIKDANCFELFANFIIVGTNEGLLLIDKKFNEIKEKMKLGKVSAISATETYLTVCIGDRAIFFDKLFQEVNTLQTPENIVFSVLLDDSFLCSCLDNKIYQFLWPSLELKLTFYGHSLPVKNFSVSTDQKLLVSCGADKLVKLWGLDFGDCRKSFVGNCKNVSFLNETLFMFCDKDLQYFNYFEKLKKFKIFNSGLTCPGTDYLIVSSDRGLTLFTMNKYEYVKEEESSELEQLAIKNISSVRDYDTFLDHLQKLEENFDEVNIFLFFNFLEKIDFNELKKYLYVLDHVSITILLKFILSTINRNSIVLFRLFLQLLKLHKETCASHEKFEEIRLFLLEKATGLRELYNLNRAQLEIEINEFDIEE